MDFIRLNRTKDVTRVDFRPSDSIPDGYLKFKFREPKTFSLKNKSEINRTERMNVLERMEYELKFLTKQFCQALSLIKLYAELSEYLSEECKLILKNFYREYLKTCDYYNIKPRVSMEDILTYIRDRMKKT